jgi:hypothetical protein
MSHTKNILKRMMSLSLLASVGFAALFSLAQTNAAMAATAPSLGTAESFAVLGGSTVTNTDNSIIRGNLGLSPGTSLTGFPPGIVVPPGTTHVKDAVAAQAQSDVTIAYNYLAGQACEFGPFGPTDLAGQNLVPGVYCFSSSVQNSGVLTLNGDSSDVWVFKIGSTLTTGPNSTVEGTGSRCNIFWQVGSSATLDTTTTFKGTIIALTSISINDGVNLKGRALARNGAVTLIHDTIDVFGCDGGGILPSVGLFKTFSPSTIGVGGVSTLTIVFVNNGLQAIQLTAPFTDNLQAPLVIAATPNVATTCIPAGAPTAIPGGSAVTLPTGTIPAGNSTAPGSCTLTVNVTAPTPGSFINTVPVSALQTSGGSNTNSPTVVLSVGAGIPTLNAWGMIIFMVLVGLIYIYYLRRQKVKV